MSNKEWDLISYNQSCPPENTVCNKEQFEEYCPEKEKEEFKEYWNELLGEKKDIPEDVDPYEWIPLRTNIS